MFNCQSNNIQTKKMHTQLVNVSILSNKRDKHSAPNLAWVVFQNIAADSVHTNVSTTITFSGMYENLNK